MNNRLECKSLFAFRRDLFQNIFEDVIYPWEVIPKIKEIIDKILSVGLDGYSLLSGKVLVGQNVKIADTARIEGPAIIGDGCEIRHGAYIRGSVILGDGCVIGNSSEVKNSILMDGAQAPHFNYIGDSILGHGAHLGAGAICSNLRSDKKPVKIALDESYITTGMRKLGAILGDGAEIGCGAVLCPGTVIGKNTTVYPLTLVRGVYPGNCIVKGNGQSVNKHPIE